MRSSLIALCGVLALACESHAWNEERLIQLARQSVSAAVRGEPVPTPASGERARPVFVTIERAGKVVGCRGSLRPRAASLEAEVMLAARGAATADPRYRPLGAADLKNFHVTVTIVEAQTALEAHQIGSLRREDGLALQSGNKWGIVLPWEGSDPRTRLGWAYKKAGVAPGSSARLFRLKAERFRG